MNAPDTFRFHREKTVVDGHCDTVHLFLGLRGAYTFGEKNTVGHVDLPRLKEGGVNIQFFAHYIEPEFKPVGALRRALVLMEHFHREIGKNKEEVVLIRSGKDITYALKTGRVGALISLEGGEALEGETDVLHALYRLGLRSVGLTWNQRNDLADGVDVGKCAGGLTELGVKIIKEMNELGILVDAAHMAPRGFYDVLSVSHAPVVVSHANAAGVCGHRRNLDDDQLRALRDHNGVVGISFYPSFLDNSGCAGLETVLDHFCYVADRFGTDILGIGSDFDGITETASGLEDISRLPRLTEGLFRRGFTASEAEKILGGNFLRVMRNVLKQEE